MRFTSVPTTQSSVIIRDIDSAAHHADRGPGRMSTPAIRRCGTGSTKTGSPVDDPVRYVTPDSIAIATMPDKVSVLIDPSTGLPTMPPSNAT